MVNEFKLYLADVSNRINELIVGHLPATKDTFCKHIAKVLREAEGYRQYLRDEWQKAREAGLTQHDDKKDKKEWFWWTAYLNDLLGVYYSAHDESLGAHFYIEGKPKADPLRYLHSMIWACGRQKPEGLEEIDYQYVLLAIIHDAQTWQGRGPIYFNQLEGKGLSDRLCVAAWHRLDGYKAPRDYKTVQQTIASAMRVVTAHLEQGKPPKDRDVASKPQVEVRTDKLDDTVQRMETAAVQESTE
ncbi:MAG: hypothetical protein H8E73_09095 [Planctomycetes bacterium]|nr:hypothetical protein [Planctomycetota bacterium]MBL7185286.1 hypothetical protein [Phycisphaerae bacterium]